MIKNVHPIVSLVLMLFSLVLKIHVIYLKAHLQTRLLVETMEHGI